MSENAIVAWAREMYSLDQLTQQEMEAIFKAALSHPMQAPVEPRRKRKQRWSIETFHRVMVSALMTLLNLIIMIGVLTGHHSVEGVLGAAFGVVCIDWLGVTILWALIADEKKKLNPPAATTGDDHYGRDDYEHW